MPKATVYSVPLNHGDKKEFERIRRDMERVGGRGAVVAYEFPNTPETRYFFSKVMGSSNENFVKEIDLLLKSIGVSASYHENIVRNWIELDRAKKEGLIAEVYPVDLDHNIKDGNGRGGSFQAKRAYEGKLDDMLMDAIVMAKRFSYVVMVLKAENLATRDVRKIRNMEMKRQIKALVDNGKTDIIFMAGVDHIPTIKKNLCSDHIAVQELEMPKDVAGIWWQVYRAMQEASRLERTNLAGMELAKEAVLLSMRALRINVGREGQPTNSEIEEVRKLETPAQARRLYFKTQRYYRGIESSLKRD